MSNLVYVIDAYGQARMPVSAIEAQELVRTGGAAWREGYVFPLIELSTQLPESILRPVAVGVVIEPAMASLWIAAAGERADDIIPLVSVALDLATNRPVRRRASADRIFDSQARDIRALIDLLSFFIPLSHIVIFDPPGSPTSVVVQRFMRYLKGHEQQRVTTATQHISAVPPPLAEWLTHCFVKRPTPDWIGVPVTVLTAFQRLNIQQEPVDLCVPGILTIGEGDNAFTGVIHRVPRNRHDIEAHVPVAIEQGRIVWQRAMIEQRLIRQNIQATTIALTPLNSVIPQHGVRLVGEPTY